MTFREWYAMPRYERRHRLLLYLADVQDAIDQRNQSGGGWVEGPEPS